MKSAYAENIIFFYTKKVQLLNRPLDEVYPFVFMDAIHYKVKENHQYVTKAAYVVLGIQQDGHKDIKAVMSDLKKIIRQ